ncbi:hypothetical protein BDK51DRAFT_25129 [Blyttiomyces helicus]|uniref:NTF2-related export protein n=1 Tax=Blyttiomyces helicus TaxID=388810 RepID=A0A4V1IRV2_9FUNG|nr:hypothetical protein BDK51DRAFT_25129 [Blyttiomyces helicus]|eukprot:RKO91347.1 hypothetical protein BDK51DRAFT_25129 [Blyttiomyces helicus]
MAVNPEEVAKAFVNFYYSTFDSSRPGLAPLYRDNSSLTFEGQQHVGVQAIVGKLSNLPFQQVQHRPSTIDAQFSDPSVGTILVAVTGQLLVDQEVNPLNFTQVFTLVPSAGSYFVFNGALPRGVWVGKGGDLSGLTRHILTF